VLEWCFSNVVGKADRRGNLYPAMQRPEQKIDAAVSLMMAMGRAMIVDEDAKGLEGFLANLIRIAQCRPPATLGSELNPPLAVTFDRGVDVSAMWRCPTTVNALRVGPRTQPMTSLSH
jgi:hypothetical protein